MFSLGYQVLDGVVKPCVNVLLLSHCPGWAHVLLCCSPQCAPSQLACEACSDQGYLVNAGPAARPLLPRPTWQQINPDTGQLAGLPLLMHTLNWSLRTQRETLGTLPSKDGQEGSLSALSIVKHGGFVYPGLVEGKWEKPKKLCWPNLNGDEPQVSAVELFEAMVAQLDCWQAADFEGSD